VSYSPLQRQLGSPPAITDRTLVTAQLELGYEFEFLTSRHGRKSPE